MTGKVWTSMLLFTTASFIMIYVHHASGCIYQDMKSHLYDLLLEDHWFEMKIFSYNKEEHNYLSLMNTLCSNWMKNKDKKEIQLINVTDFFLIMLEHFFKINERNEQSTTEIKHKCMKYNCTVESTYTIQYISKTAFGSMYLKYCNKSVSDLKCPSEKSVTSTICPSVATSELEISSASTIRPNITPEPIQDYRQNVLVTEHVVLTASLILNILFGMWCLWRRKPPQAGPNTEARLIQMADMQTVI